jgi:hypothetical protein
MAQPAPLTDVDPQAEPDYYDNGPDGEVAAEENNDGDEYSQDATDTYPRREAGFAYPEEYFYKYGYHYYNYADPEGRYGYDAESANQTSDAVNQDAAEPAREDHIGEIGNAANYGQERDLENSSYELGDGTTADLNQVANGLAQNENTGTPETVYPSEHGDGMYSEYDYGYGRGHGYPYGYDGDYATDQGQWNSEQNSSNAAAEAEGHEDTATDQASEAYNDEMNTYAMNEANNGQTEADQPPAEEMYAEEGTANEANPNEAKEDADQQMSQATDEANSSASYGSDYGYDADSGYHSEDDQSAQYGFEAEYGHSAEYNYEYSYPEEKYGYSSEQGETSTTDAAAPAETKVDHEAEYDFDSRYEGEPGELIDYSQWNESYGYEYAEPYEYYSENRSRILEAYEAEKNGENGPGYDEPQEGSPTTEELRDVQTPVESGLELFGWRPSDLLVPPDQQVLRNLETLCEEPSGTRRSVLNDYLEGMGYEAIDFASRFEDVTGIEALSLADDLPGTAAFLACFRLVEQGELGMDEAVDLLRRTLERPSLDWIEGVRAITAGAFDDWNGMPASIESQDPQAEKTTSTQKPLAEAVAASLVNTWSQLHREINEISQQIAQLDWASWLGSLQQRLAEAHTTSEYETF